MAWRGGAMNVSDEKLQALADGVIGFGRLFAIDRTEVVEFSRYLFKVQPPGSDCVCDVEEGVLIVLGDEVDVSRVAPSLRQFARQLKPNQLSLVNPEESVKPYTWRYLWGTPDNWKHFAAHGDFESYWIDRDDAVSFSRCRVRCYRSHRCTVIHHLSHQIIIAAGTETNRAQISDLVVGFAKKLESDQVAKLEPVAAERGDVGVFERTNEDDND
jgi:hypothetical protein